MALDSAGSVLATVFRSPPRLMLLDTKAGAVTANLPSCGDADDVFFDAKHRRLYVSCGEGLVDVLQGDTAGYQGWLRIRARITHKPKQRPSSMVSVKVCLSGQ